MLGEQGSDPSCSGCLELFPQIGAWLTFPLLLQSVFITPHLSEAFSDCPHTPVTCSHPCHCTSCPTLCFTFILHVPYPLMYYTLCLLIMFMVCLPFWNVSSSTLEIFVLFTGVSQAPSIVSGTQQVPNKYLLSDSNERTILSLNKLGEGIRRQRLPGPWVLAPL